MQIYDIFVRIFRILNLTCAQFNFISSCRTSLSTEDCYQIGKQLNSAKMYSEAIEWLKEALKHYNEYYDQHQVSAIQILEQLALSFINNNQESKAREVIGKILRIDSNNKILSSMVEKRRTITDLCRPVEELQSFLTFTCPINV